MRPLWRDRQVLQGVLSGSDSRMEGKGKPVDPSSDDSLRPDEIPGMELELKGWG